MTVLLGLAGVIVGFLLKAAWDLVTEARSNTRQDVLWRREKYVDAAASLIHTNWEQVGAEARLSRAIFSLMNAERGGDPAIIDSCRRENEAAGNDHWPLPAKAHHELQLIRLYGPPKVYRAAQAVVDDTKGPVPKVLELEAAWESAQACRDALADAVRESLERTSTRPFWWPGQPRPGGST